MAGIPNMTAAEYHRRGLGRYRNSLGPSEMNKTERRYSDHLYGLWLAGDIIAYAYQGITFQLAPNTTYTPDFLVLHPDYDTIIEIKGYLEDDASVKFKVAADMYPRFEFVMLREHRGEFVKVRKMHFPARR